MSWSAAVCGEPQYVEARFAGALTADDLRAAAAQTLALAARLPRPLVLADCSELAGGHSVVDLYALADIVAADPLAAQGIREALLFPALPGPASDVAFWETTCHNRGLTVRAFTDRAEALAWLLGREPA
jgi:hypothetical protein